MQTYTCPKCQSEMKRIQERDIATDRCLTCSSIFLEKGELNILATSMKGNIEYSSIHDDDHKHSDKFAVRTCPKCSDKEMHKINLLGLSDIIFDFCTNCESFFLDKGEVKAMNEYLKEMTPYGVEQEYRGYRDEHLVRIDRRLDTYLGGKGVMVGMPTEPVIGVKICISIYLNRPLKTELRVFQEKWYAQLAQAIGLYRVSDITTANYEFDRIFRVQGENEKDILNALSEDIRRAMVDFVSRNHQIYHRSGSIELTSNFISYVEGPYEQDKKPDLMEKCEPVIQELLSLAGLLESTK